VRSNNRFANGFYAILMTALLGSASAEDQQGPGTSADDANITAEVKTQIFREPSLKSGEINIETVQGVVRLSGFVTSEDKVVTAGQMAASVQGVVSVENNLQVK